MKYTIIALVAAASVATAQFDGVPSCAQPCVKDFTSGSKIAGCSLLDIGCVCGNSSFLSDIACCVADKCDADGQKSTIDYAKKICSGYADTPDEVVCSSAAGGSSAAASPTASGGSGGSGESASVAPTGSGGASETPTPTSGGDSGTPASETPSGSGAAVALGGAGSVVGAVVAMAFAL